MELGLLQDFVLKMNSPISTRYTIPPSSYFESYKSDYLESRYSDQLAGLDEVNDIVLVKILLPPDEGTNASQPQQSLIFECEFNGKYVKYYPEMFINICHNFLTADKQLRTDIYSLLRSSQLVR